jgi:hypothetical protein
VEFPRFLLREKHHSNKYLKLGARHAVVGTLCSRAHRIGLIGASYWLRGLREDASFGLLTTVTICGLLDKPGFEIIIALEEEFECLRDDVRRRGLDELRITVELGLYRLLYASLDRYCLRLPGRCFNDCHLTFLFLPFGFVLWAVLQTGCYSSFPRPKHELRIPGARGGSDP